LLKKLLGYTKSQEKVAPDLSPFLLKARTLDL
jgi:hypothetical protein